MQADVLLTLKLQQRLFADPRRIALLKQIAQTGSISQGAKLADISYKSAWDAISAMNELSEHTLVERATGGKGGGGASLTSYGARLVQLYDLLTQIQQNAFNALSDDCQPLDSLLTALARVSLQTSARNQWFGTVIAQPDDGLQPHVAIMLDDGVTRINAAVTAYSAQRLGLQPGKAVQVLVKAPWVTLSRDADADADAAHTADNHLNGIVSRIDTQGDISEVLVTLPSGHTLCATLSAADLAAAAPEEGAAITAFFNADRVILATLC